MKDNEKKLRNEINTLRATGMQLMKKYDDLELKYMMDVTKVRAENVRMLQFIRNIEASMNIKYMTTNNADDSVRCPSCDSSLRSLRLFVDKELKLKCADPWHS